MSFRFFLFLAILVLNAFSIYAQDSLPPYKKRLSPAVYEQWKSLGNIITTAGGQWMSYEINPAKGDGFLVVLNTESGVADTIERATDAEFSPDGSFIAFVIKPQYARLRQMKLDKVKKSKLPKDSLGILLLGNDSLIKIPKVKRFAVADTLSDVLVYESLMKKKRPAGPQKHWWDFMKKKKPAAKAKKQDGVNLWIYQPATGYKKNYRDVDEYELSKDGHILAIVKVLETDSAPVSKILYFNTKDKTDSLFFDRPGTVKNFSFDREARQAAFLFAGDTAKKHKVFNLYFAGAGLPPALLADTTTAALDSGFCPSANGQIYFSKDGSKLYFGVAKKPEQEPEDTLLKSEKYSVDIWNYQDGLLQPEQKLRAAREKRRTYLTVYHIDLQKIVQLENPHLRSVRIYRNGNSHWALAVDNLPYERERSWDGFYSDVYVVNTIDNRKDLVLKHHSGYASLSADGGYLLYFNKQDSSWYAYDVRGRRRVNLTRGMKVNFYNEDNDVPALPRSYGMEGWYSGDKFVVIRDRYDLWKFDPSGRLMPVNLTGGYGRTHKILFRSVQLNRLTRYFNDENPHLLNAFNEENKQDGFFQLADTEGDAPVKLIMTNHRYYSPHKPEKANYLYWRRMNFKEYPEVYISDMQFKNIRKITNTNPQQKDYLWGTVERTHWKSFDGIEYDGLVYKPENFDSTLRYPLIVYFYERNSDNIHQHYTPHPSHSIIGFTEYVSQGYVVFVPDIRYRTGHPGRSAYDAVVSGTRHMMQYPWIDSARIGLQGQSWGGYEVAYLVTQTDLYACAEAGAPVSNMISAYGGIRWGSGMSRAFQYEKTQSRIGCTPWDSLELYIENSPIFFAPQVNTPLLIMHNDKDGAVPWYQGIEYFNALRRLDKKVWMLSYNNDGHNLMKWPNRVDLSIRMMQFFNHYLKDEPMPLWMSKGIPAVEKGQETGYELK